MLVRNKSLMLQIDNESIHIFIDNGMDNEPIHVCYWHIEEFEEDGTVAIAAARAVELFYKNPDELLKILNIKSTICENEMTDIIYDTLMGNDCCETLDLEFITNQETSNNVISFDYHGNSFEIEVKKKSK